MVPPVISEGTYPISAEFCRPEYFDPGTVVVFDGCYDGVPPYQYLFTGFYGEDVYYAHDCDFIYIGIERTVNPQYGIFQLELAFIGAFNITVPGDGIVIPGVEVLGFTTECVEIRIDRSILPDPCKVDPIAMEIRIHGITYSGEWMHAILDDVMYDCGPAEIKKFLEIYKQVIIPGDPDMTEEVYCTDFEEPCDIYDEWATFDMYPTWGDNGAIDTWTWSDKRSNSPDHSFHSTSFDTYLGNQFDILQLLPIDVSDYYEVVFNFSHWMEGDAIDVGGVTTIQDGGYVEFKFDADPWAMVPGSEVYYDNDWTDESFTIPVTGDELSIRFVFFSDPAFCYEGWYVDDVCLYGFLPGAEDEETWEFVTDSHSWEQIMEGECLVHEFIEAWEATEGIYKICVWFQVLDDCHYTNDTSDNQFCIIVEVDDVICLEEVALYVTPDSPAWEGDDVHIFSDVQNLGTIPAEDVQVRVTVNRGTIGIEWEDSAENIGDYDQEYLGMAMCPGGVTTASPFWDDEYYNLFWQHGAETRSVWHVTDYDSSDGTYALADYDESTAQPWEPRDSTDGYGASAYVLTPYNFAGSDYLAEPTLIFDAKHNYGIGEEMRIGLLDDSAGSGYIYTLPTVGAVGTESHADWTTYEVPMLSLMQSMVPAVSTPGDTDISAWFYTPRDADTTGDPACPWNGEWSGLMLDNVQKQNLIVEPGIIYQETVIIDIINESTFWTPGEIKTAEFIWPDVLPGRYVITQEVLGEVGDCNAVLITPYNVINYEENLDDWEFIDHTGGDDCFWMVDDCCGGSLWVGDTETTMYGNNWDQLLYIAPDGDKTLDDVFPEDLEFDQWYQIEAPDVGTIEVSDDDGDHWTQIYSINGDSATDPEGEDEWEHVIVAIPAGTDQIRFRFISNDTITNRGWMIDNIFIDGIIDDPAESLDNFICEEMSYGNWWQSPDQYHYFMIEDYIYGIGSGIYDYEETWWWWEGGTDVIPDFVNNIEDPADTYGCFDTTITPQFTGNIEGYPQNIDNSMQTTIDMDKVFFGWMESGTVADMGDFDTLFVEYSNDGENWEVNDELTGYALLRHTIINFQDEFQEGEIDVRFRVVSDDIGISGHPWWFYGYYGGGFLGWFPAWNFAFGATVNEPTFYGMKDTHAPVTTITLEGTFDETYHYYTSDVAVYLDATDDITGVAATYYILDGVEYEYTRPFVVDGDGEHTLCFYSVDFEGNVEEQKCVPPFLIDQSGPSITITGPEPGIYLMGNKILNSDKYIFLFGGVTVSASVTVEDAPLQTVEFYMNNELFAEDTSAPYTMTCTLKNSGSATFKVVAKDVLGETDQDELTVDTYLKIF
jgi:hypothetical protein